MTPEELGTKMGNIAAQAFNFLYDNLAKSPKITARLKKNVKLEREKTFARLIPLIKQYRTFGEEDATEIRRIMALQYLEGMNGGETEIYELNSVVGTIFEGDDKDFTMDTVSLFMILEFLEEHDDEESQTLYKHVGLL
ncbi:MAG TPA: hypothetical protein PKW37_05290 [Salinivirgaceae bacterium]|mgnify:FL=1|nr:hypothetical protein [Salinivirgaceae bacterium]